MTPAEMRDGVWTVSAGNAAQGVALAAREAGVKIGAWTVNEPADIERMVALGVDAICTDFPNRLNGD